MSTFSGTAYQDTMAVPASGSVVGHLIDVTTAERQDGLSSNSNGQQDLVDANRQTSSLDDGGQIRTTDADRQNQGSMYLGPINAARLNQGLTYLGMDEEKLGVDVAGEVPDSHVHHPVTDNESVSENDNNVTHADLAGFVNPPSCRTAGSRESTPPLSTHMNPSRFFPIWFGREPAPKPAADNSNIPPTTNKTRWGDFDGSEHPFGNIPDGWCEVYSTSLIGVSIIETWFTPVYGTVH